MTSLRWADWPKDVGAAVGAVGGHGDGVATDGRLDIAIPARDGLVLAAERA